MATTDLVHHIKQGDDRPDVQLTLTAGLNLTGGSVTFRMVAMDGTAKVDDASATIVTAGDGAEVQPVIRYSWASGDTDTAGTFRAEFTVTYSDSSVETYPNEGHVWVEIEETA